MHENEQKNSRKPFTSLRVIHISDVHFGLESVGQKLAYEDIRRELVSDIGNQAHDHGAADLIFLVGDIAQNGVSPQYEEAAAWLQQIMIVSGVTSEKLICTVPGNHDVNRAHGTALGKRWQKAIREKPNEAHEILAEIADELEVNHPLLRMQNEYLRFAERYGCDFQSNLSPLWTKSFQFACGVSLKLWGLNTAQVSDENDALAKMVVGRGQLDFITLEDDTVSLIMMHHPLPWLMDSYLAETAFHSRAKVIVTGHEHTQSVETQERPKTGKLLHIASGAATPPKGAVFTYNWLDISVLRDTPSSCTLQVKITPRTWSEKEKFFASDYSQFEAGNISFTETINCNLRTSKTAHRFANNNRGSSSEGLLLVPKNFDNCSDNSNIFGEPSAQIHDEQNSAVVQEDDPRYSRLRDYYWSLEKDIRQGICCQLALLIIEDSQDIGATRERIALRDARRRGILKDLNERISKHLDLGSDILFSEGE